MRTLGIVSNLLNPTKYIPTKDHLLRDWRGLAELIGCTREDISSLDRSVDPTLNVLKKWSEEKESLISSFLLFLQKMDRYDVFDDIIELVIVDINSRKVIASQNVDTSLFITMKDRELLQQGLPPKQYHASMLYADDDEQFVVDVVKILEEKYKLDIFLKQRDLVGGTIEHEATLKIIAERSNRLIIILTPAFLKSTENKYIMSFAQSIEIDQRKRKIIPCIYKDCQIPYELRPLHKLYYRKSGMFCNFYEKLYSSIISSNTLALPRSIETALTLSNCTIPTSPNTLTVPEIVSNSIAEHSSLPDLSIQSNHQSSEEDTDAVSQSSLPVEQPRPKKKTVMKKFRKIFKIKEKPVAV
ncbi:putative TIR domain protein [Trypoxylus dichotomus]